MSLVAAAKIGDTDTISQLLDAGVDINERVCGETACYAAVEAGHFSAVRLLVERGADIFALHHSHKISLLDAALFCGREDITLLLLDAGAPLDAKSCLTVSGVADASVAVLRRLQQRSIDFSALRHVAFENSVIHLLSLRAVKSFSSLQDRLLFFVDVANVDIDAKNCCGQTALWSCFCDFVHNGQECKPEMRHCFDLLIAVGIDIGARDNWGNTICHYVAKYCDYLVLCTCLCFCDGQKLLDQPNSLGETPRMWAIGSKCAIPTNDDLAAARKRIVKLRFDLVRERAFQVCVGLRALDLDALQMCEILLHSCGSIASLIYFHQWWAIATTVKHFR